MAGIREYVQIGDESSLAMKTEAWIGFIEPAIEELDVLSDKWTNQENIQTYTEIKSFLPQFKEKQEEVEELVEQGDNESAWSIVNNELSPIAKQLTSLLETISKDTQIALSTNLDELDVATDTFNRSVKQFFLLKCH